FPIPGGVLTMLEDEKRGRLYLGTISRGLAIADHGALTFLDLALPRGPIYALFLDSKEDLWVGTERGLAIVRDGLAIDLSRLFSRAVYAFHESARGTMWIGTRDSGLLRYREATGELARITSREGLFNNTVYTILEDRRRRFWMSSDQGVYATAI